MSGFRKLALIALVVALVAATPVLAQSLRGSLFLTVTTEEGETVSGAEVKLLSQNITRTMTSDADGHVRFTSLDPGNYSVEIKKEGYNIAIYEGIVIASSQDVEMSVSIQASDIVETVVVTSETPVVDRRKLGTETVISPTEMEKLPQARDPWAVLSTVPGLQTDRINVGGNQSGQQSGFSSKGDDGFQSQWVMDGVDFSDLAAQGGSATYFDFNMFQEIAFTTGGGTSLEQTQPGVSMNFVSKQGSNRHTGSIGLIFAGNDFQDSGEKFTNPNGTNVRGNRIDENFEKFFEIGGPVVKDKVWYWAGFSQNDINILVPSAGDTSQSDRTKLRSLTGKFNGTFGGKTNWQAFYTNTDKSKIGRNAGPTRPPETSWDQEGPSPIYNAEIGHFVTPNLELSLQASHVAGGFSLTPQGTAPVLVRDTGGVWHNTFYGISTDRPTDQIALRGNWFLETGNLSHELKFGFKRKEGEVTTITTYGTDTSYAIQFSPGFGWVTRLRANAPVGGEMNYNQLWAGDTILWNNWTFNIGATWWQQDGKQLPATLDANPIEPVIVPALEFAGFDPGFEWDDVLVRAGVTYQFDTARRQVLRASFNQYADQLGYGDVVYNNPTAPGGVALFWDWDCSNFASGPGCGDFVVDPNEVDNTDEIFRYNVDPNNPGGATPVDFIDTNFSAPTVDEFIVGYELEVMPNLSVGVNYTNRTRDNVSWAPILDINSVNPGDGKAGSFDIIPSSAWEVGNGAGTTSFSNSIGCDPGATGLPGGGTSGPCSAPGEGASWTTTPYYLTNAANLTTSARQQILTNRPGYEETYDGIELTVNKRLSNKWMLRGYVAWQDWTKSVPANAIQNPSNLQGDTTKDGSIVVASGGTRSGAFGNVFYGTSTWSYNINGLYQLPKNFTISANLNGREGYALPYYNDVEITDDDGQTSTPGYQINNADSYRLDDLHILDLRLGYLLRLSGNTTVDLGLEVFNVFDDQTILQYESRQAIDGVVFDPSVPANRQPTSRAGYLEETLSPRVMRLSARVTF